MTEIETLPLKAYRPFLASKLQVGIESYHDCLLMHADICLRDRSGAPILETCLRRGQQVAKMGDWQQTPSGQILPSKLSPQPQRYPVDFPMGKPQDIRLIGNELLCCEEEILFIPSCDLDHFGHLLTESAAYLGGLLRGFLKEKLNQGMLLIVGKATESSMHAISLLLAIKRERILSTQSIKGILSCKLAWMPRPTMVNRFGIHHEHFQSVKALVDKLIYLQSSAPTLYPALGGRPPKESKVNPAAKLYLSRSMLPAEHRHMNREKELEESLVKRGWQIIHPETLTLKSQISYLKSAHVIASPIGSALHLLMYLGMQLSCKQVIGLGLKSGRLNPNFIFQFQQQNMGFTHLGCLDVDSGAQRPSAWSDLKLIAQPRIVADSIEACLGQ